jgi:hypothetical protein
VRSGVAFGTKVTVSPVPGGEDSIIRRLASRSVNLVIVQEVVVRQPARLQAMVNGWLRKSINYPDSCVGLKIPTSQDGVYRVSVRCIIIVDHERRVRIILIV